MNKSKIYGRPFFENGKIFYPYLNMESRRSFAFYANYRYLTDYASNKKIPVMHYVEYEKTTSNEGLARYRRTVLFSDSSHLMPMPYSSIFFDSLYDRVKKSKSLSHATSWVSLNGTKFILNEPYVVDEYFAELLDEEGLIFITVPLDLSPYCGWWDPLLDGKPRTKSYLICDKKDIRELEYIQIKLEQTRVGFDHPKSLTPPSWNCLKGVQYD